MDKETNDTLMLENAFNTAYASTTGINNFIRDARVNIFTLKNENKELKAENEKLKAEIEGLKKGKK